MRHAIIPLLLAITSTAWAQGSDIPAGPSRARQAQVQARFTSADANNDGRLTREEANGRMPHVAAHFDAIDKNKAGYLTLDQIQAWLQEQEAAKRGNTFGLLLYR